MTTNCNSVGVSRMRLIFDSMKKAMKDDFVASGIKKTNELYDINLDEHIDMSYRLKVSSMMLDDDRLKNYEDFYNKWLKLYKAFITLTKIYAEKGSFSSYMLDIPKRLFLTGELNQQ